ncbi:MAG TPA: hypothetical protein VFV28_06730 [Limnobacter sp.]|nr:hypothetical protein [Limnobacter sp.]
MQSLKLLPLLLLLQLSSACSVSNQQLADRLFLVAKNECQLIFKSDDVLLTENFCESGSKPISIQFAKKEIQTGWIDEATSHFLFQEGCAETQGCFYEIKLRGSTVQGRFVYQVNLTEGEYHFEIDPAGQVKVLSHSVRDIAS